MSAVNKTIWKYPLPIQHEVRLMMPSLARPLSVGAQLWGEEEVLTLWALVDPECAIKAYEPRFFLICGAGHPTAPLSADGFLGTVQMPRSGLVWHVWEEER